MKYEFDILTRLFRDIPVNLHESRVGWPLQPDADSDSQCVHRGVQLRLQKCPSCRGNVREKVFACDVPAHPECQLGNKLPGVKSCVGCSDRITPLRPLPTDPPTPRPAKFTREPTRHLIYHIWPHNRSGNWRWNIGELLRRIDLFDGVRSIGVVTDQETATLADVQSAFGSTRIDHWFESPNQPLIGEPGNVMSDDGASALLGEGLSFLPLLHTLPRGDNDVTFYGHARGARYTEGDGHIERHRRWSRMLYRTNLDNWPTVREALRSFPMAGSFKRYEDFKLTRNFHWHYSGTFFWFRNSDVFASTDWPRLHPAMYGQVEAWPAGMFRSSEVACLFGDGAKHLYVETELQKWEAML